ncbi:hypothetical protein niasHT_030842 [Heterodera trifolii]|uniref:Uncharacterized protein n=1 Tax=Heterodera trifolii TaxID=157864 RepID=A0ABD2HQW8_9BILA
MASKIIPIAVSSPSFNFLRRPLPSLVFRRSIFKSPLDAPFCGIYRTNDGICRTDDIFVCQRKMNYHLGANVRHQRDRNQHLLKAVCDGTVVITRGKTYEEFKQEYERESVSRRAAFTRGTIFSVLFYPSIFVGILAFISVLSHRWYTYHGTGRELRPVSNVFVRFVAAFFGCYSYFPYNTDPDPEPIPAVEKE